MIGKKRAKLRTPFVTTFAAAAAAAAVVACGGSVGGGNPPPLQSCPSAAPAVGDGCSVAGDGVCSYGSGPCSPAYRCVDGRFERRGAICNPPAPVCPATEPLGGSTCANDMVCTYPDACTAEGTNTATCAGGTWSVSAAKYTVACPAAKPTSGASCAACARHYPASCTYDPCFGGQPTTLAECSPSTGLWEVRSSSCNPPPPPRDAGTPPDSGVMGDGGVNDASAD